MSKEKQIVPPFCRVVAVGVHVPDMRDVNNNGPKNSVDVLDEKRSHVAPLRTTIP